MLSKIRFAIANPSLTARFIQRELTRRFRKKQSSYTRLVKPRRGRILSTHFFDQADFRGAKDSKAAERILKGELCLYGQRNFKADKKINWQKDYLGNFEWPTNKFSYDIVYDYPVGVDIKNPWEVSRGHQLITVAKAYRESGDERFASYVVETISDWI